jgi:putative exporter of polyketide antibiotics
MLTVLLSACIAYVAYRIGKRRGADEMYYLCRSADQAQREFFSRVSLN